MPPVSQIARLRLGRGHGAHRRGRVDTGDRAIDTFRVGRRRGADGAIAIRRDAETSIRPSVGSAPRDALRRRRTPGSRSGTAGYGGSATDNRRRGAALRPSVEVAVEAAVGGEEPMERHLDLVDAWRATGPLPQDHEVVPVRVEEHGRGADGMSGFEGQPPRDGHGRGRVDDRGRGLSGRRPSRKPRRWSTIARAASGPTWPRSRPRCAVALAIPTMSGLQRMSRQVVRQQVVGIDDRPPADPHAGGAERELRPERAGADQGHGAVVAVDAVPPAAARARRRSTRRARRARTARSAASRRRRADVGERARDAAARDDQGAERLGHLCRVGSNAGWKALVSMRSTTPGSTLDRGRTTSRQGRVTQVSTSGSAAHRRKASRSGVGEVDAGLGVDADELGQRCAAACGRGAVRRGAVVRDERRVAVPLRPAAPTRVRSGRRVRPPCLVDPDGGQGAVPRARTARRREDEGPAR